MLDLLIACALGICYGAFTGFVPGIHVNIAGAIIFAASAFLLTVVSVEFLCVFMVAMSIAHAVIEFAPSMLLGVPQEGTALTILPDHRMVLEGRAKEAIRSIISWFWGYKRHCFNDACICCSFTFPCFCN